MTYFNSKNFLIDIFLYKLLNVYLICFVNDTEHEINF